MYQLELLDTAWIMLIGIFRHVICLNIVPWCRPISGDGTGPSVTRLSSDSPRQWESVSLRLRAERPRRSQQNTVIIEWRAKAYRVRHLKPRQLNSPTFLQLALCIVIASKKKLDDQEIQDGIRMESFQMNNGDPPPPVSGAGGGHQRTTNDISMDSAIAALEQHDTLFHRQVMHLRQQQVRSYLSGLQKN